MRSYLHILAGWCFAALLFSCNKEDDFSPPSPSNPVISNLQFSPTTVVIKPGQPTFTLSGNFEFKNATGGVATIILTSNYGVNFTVPVPDNSNSEGILTGLFEFTMPSSPIAISFEVWMVDKQGRSSNKLSGSFQLVIDDSGNSWSIVSQQWQLDKVVWANNIFMAVGQNGEILTSANGTSWTKQNSGVNRSLFGIVRSNTQWVVVGSSGTILTSPDGNTWTIRNTDASSLHLMGVAWSGSRYVAVGNELPGNIPIILTSTDAITWYRNEFTATSGSLNAITWANNRFVAVGKDYRPFIISSADGLNWSGPVTSSEMQGEFTDVLYNGNLWAAVGFGITATSADAVSWSFANASNLGLTGIVWSGKHFIAVGITGMYRSTDGLNWTKINDTAYIPRSIAWSGLQYVVVGFISPILMVSP